MKWGEESQILCTANIWAFLGASAAMASPPRTAAERRQGPRRASNFQQALIPDRRAPP